MQVSLPSPAQGAAGHAAETSPRDQNTRKDRDQTFDVVIVGGGLAGLALAEHLQAAGASWCLLEARSRFGGRIKSVSVASGGFDLGPSWFWPGQLHMEALIGRLGRTIFPQYATGVQGFENFDGSLQWMQGGGSMAGSLRVEGGMASIVDALIKTLPSERLRLRAPVRRVHQGQPLAVQLADGERVAARRVVLALPPRIAACLSFQPALPAETIHKMTAIPTWMAGQAKVCAVYDKPFWRDLGLSGDAFSGRGPMSEIHDATDARGPAALFGFIGVPPAERQGRAEEIKVAAVEQLCRIFSDVAGDPLALHYQDWSQAQETATALDRVPPRQHPLYAMPAVLEDIWNGQLLLGSSETADRHGGFLEGALVRARSIADRLSGDLELGKNLGFLDRPIDETGID